MSRKHTIPFSTLMNRMKKHNIKSAFSSGRPKSNAAGGQKTEGTGLESSDSESPVTDVSTAPVPPGSVFPGMVKVKDEDEIWDVDLELDIQMEDDYDEDLYLDIKIEDNYL